jgi:hypothetical protein
MVAHLGLVVVVVVVPSLSAWSFGEVCTICYLHGCLAMVDDVNQRVPILAWVGRVRIRMGLYGTGTWGDDNDVGSFVHVDGLN